ncbi:aryl-sulfate sulfotransferase [Flagellimonas sp.]|uniref:aryl-sulfate sulfotransferase n=1 Tax=Flagellimonas sp. TaxID=2058762 RepID=UPI003B4FFE92
MMKKLLSPILLVFTSLLLFSCSSDNDPSGTDDDTGSQPPPDPEIVIPSTNTVGVLKKESGVFDGYTLFTIHKDTYLIDLCGRVINHWKSEYDRGGGFYLLEDGSLLRAGKIDNPDLPYGGIGGIIEKFDWDGNLLWDYRLSTPMLSQHHGLYQLPNGNILTLVATRKTGEEAIQAGRDLNNLVDNELYNEQILEIQPTGNSGGNIVWEWNAWDHLVQDLDETKDNFGSVFNNPQLIDINFTGTTNPTGVKDWLHFNSLQYNQDFNQIIISSQKLSEIYIIDHTTTTEEAATGSGGTYGKGGDILYRWGNPVAYDHGRADDQILFGQHFPHWIPNGHPDEGKLLIFNNGLGRPTNFSTVEIITPPTDASNNYVYDTGVAYGPTTPDWTYIDPTDPTLFYSRIVSSAQRLENGNTLFCEGTKGKFSEINSNGEIVWEYVNPEKSDGTITTQGQEPASNVFRALRYGLDYPAFTGKQLTPGNPIELDFNIGNCR